MRLDDNKVVAANLLIVDDDAAIRDSLSEGLALEGIKLEIRTAHNAVSAMQEMQEWVPDVVILDYNMPLGDGFTLAQEIQAVPALRQTKLIMLTAQDTSHMSWESVEHKIDVFLGKPFDIADLEAMIFSLLTTTAKRRAV